MVGITFFLKNKPSTFYFQESRIRRLCFFAEKETSYLCFTEKRAVEFSCYRVKGQRLCIYWWEEAVEMLLCEIKNVGTLLFWRNLPSNWYSFPTWRAIDFNFLEVRFRLFVPKIKTCRNFPNFNLFNVKYLRYRQVSIFGEEAFEFLFFPRESCQTSILSS